MGVRIHGAESNVETRRPLGAMVRVRVRVRVRLSYRGRGRGRIRVRVRSARLMIGSNQANGQSDHADQSYN